MVHLSRAHHLQMTTLLATILLRLVTRDNDSVLGPEPNGGEVWCGTENGVDGRAESLVSIPNTVPSDADVSLGHSIQLPIEVWEKVIDVLADEWVDPFRRDKTYEARLRALGRVCRGWHVRCRFRAWEKLDVDHMDKTEVYHLINALNQDPERCHTMKTVSFYFGRMSIGLFGTFVVCTAQKLPRVKRLILGGCEWDTGQLHAQVFVHITLAFESVTVLELDHVRFPSAVVFGRLVHALPRLSSLKCWSVFFERRGDVAGRIWELHPLRLDSAEVLDSDDVVDFLVSIGAQLRHLSWRDESLEKCQELLPVTAESLSSIQIDITEYSFVRRFSPTDFLIDFTPAVNLRVLSISSHFQDLDTVANRLSRVFLPKLVEVTIISTFVHTEIFPSLNIQDELEEVRMDSYALLDQAFSSRLYPALKKVTFKLHCRTPRSKVMEVISEESWRTHFASNLPALHTSGRLV
ncbi:uncharacterized protein FIBRA_09274 [Fibroporia radiculosa]|uniref:F-box domain-containing protein n=1 Tax=Fibroporia radiculosa TaxID=599839 RepID=J7RVN5_9APHY|nr:uncharacterized protein FIBRA_09274 [Fibroporia radiculosa]CCM06960.1 predicted protein [Fibroporia radiculosa]